MRILGLDASSSTIGWSILDHDDATNTTELIAYDYIKPPKKGNLLVRLHETRSLVNKVLNKYKPDIVAIEDIVSFMQGGSTAKTILLLAAFNRMVGLACFDFLEHPPALFNVMSIRHGIKLTKDLPKKEDIPALVESLLGITLEMSTSIKERNDVADSIAVALFAIKRIRYLKSEIDKPIKSSTNRKRNNATKKKRKLLEQELAEITGKDA